MAEKKDRRIKNEVDLVLRVLHALDSIREETGFGTIELDVKDGLVVYVRKTVRDHLS